MYSTSAAKKRTVYTETVDLPPVSVLLNCRTVVEKTGFVSTGILTMAEGDLMEVEIGDYQRFDLGENVNLTIYTPAGMFRVQTSIIAKDPGFLMVINPPENQRKFSEKREFPRVDVIRQGRLLSREEPASIEMKNISLGGIGFAAHEELGLQVHGEAEVELDLGFPLTCTVQIVRTENSPEGMPIYGARYIRFQEEKYNPLRAFILRAQIETHTRRKAETSRKRTFK